MRLSILDGATEVDADAWDRLQTGPSPFCEHAFLAALERSGSVGRGTGWQPLFLCAWEGDELVGAVPAYLKGHSYGEYIFDWSWAEAAQRAGLPYYPKLVVAVPFTPATGRRILLAPGAGEDVARALAAATMDAASQLGASSVHWLFVTQQERDLLADVGYHPRLTLQYHFRNQGWETFDDYLGAMRSKRRREIRRERRKVAEQGLTVRMLGGEELDDEHWRAIERFYRDTSSRKWGQAYLSSDFFVQIRETFSHRVRFAAGYAGDDLVAGALCFERDEGLYGRYWGCDARFEQLHFETCFYAPIEDCIERGVQLYEAGAQGQHKIPRGFLPTGIHSAHWVAHPGLHDAVGDFVEAEARQNRRVIEALAQHSPFR